MVVTAQAFKRTFLIHYDLMIEKPGLKIKMLIVLRMRRGQSLSLVLVSCLLANIPPITYYWTGLLILDQSYLVGNLTNSKIAETKALEPLKS